ncbi:MAG: hypothetical protein AAB553_07615 [Patescibacteria group bacterium]
MYAFDFQLKEAIEEIFAHNGIPWEDWGAWTCPDFPLLVTEANAGLTEVTQKKVTIKTRVSTKQIIEYLFSISKTASLSGALKEKIVKELWDKLVEIFPQEKRWL